MQNDDLDDPTLPARGHVALDDRPRPRVAIIYDDVLRPDTTGVYCLRALREFADVRHFLPSGLAEVPRSGFDLYLYVDDGLDYPLPAEFAPSAFWAIDTHLRPQRLLRRLPGVDFAFAAQRDGVDVLRGHGVNCLGWLPLACDPDVHRRHAVTKSIDACLLANLNTPARRDLAALVRREFPNSLVDRRYFDRMAAAYSASRLVLNLSVRNDVNMRVFEAAACGSLLLTNDLTDNGLAELFTPGEHLVTYRGFDELVERARHYLAHEEERERLAEAGRRAALDRHTYAHRMRELLARVAGERRCRRSPVLSTPTSTSCPAGVVDVAEAKPSGKRCTSIVIVTFDQLHHTRACLESVRRCTADEAYEVVVVDNGSTDGTREYLLAQPDVRVVQNDANRGFPAAANQGIHFARGARVLLLNNDAVVTPGWLTRMLRPLEASADVGLVGPSSNNVSGPQQVPADYGGADGGGGLDGLDGFAEQWAARHAGLTEDVDRLVGFCMLARRDVVDRLGPLDERFGIGNFEDDDYCRRARAAGLRCVIARDAFVHHYGSATFRASGVDYDALMARNRRLFEDKWRQAGGPSDAAGTVGHESWPPPSPSAKLSMCMIARDSSRTIGAALRSVRPWVDEIIVVDTGSADDTAAIAQGAGARVYHFPWCDDFSAARNESLRHATGDLLFWMDSDDTIDEANGRGLRALADGPHAPAVLGYVVQVHCPGEPGDGGDAGGGHVTVVDHVKLLQNRPDLRFEGRIHEQILPAIRRAGGDVAWTDLFVVHSGSDRSPEGRRRKQRRDLRLLELELVDRPGHTFTLFNLGMTYADMGEHGWAVEMLRASLGACAPGESHVRKCYALLAGSYQQLGQHADAREACAAGLALYPDDPELLFRKAMVAHELGRLEEAAGTYETLLNGRPARHFTSVDRDLASAKARNNLAAVLTDLGRPAEAEVQWRRLLEATPASRAGWQGLCDSLLRQGKLAELEREIGRWRAKPGVGASAGEVLLAEAQLALARGDVEGARHRLQAAERQDRAGDHRALRALCRLTFEHGPAADSIEAHRRLADLDGEDPSVWHNLGTLYLRARRPDEAADACRRSLRLRPQSAATQRLLSQALALCDQRDEMPQDVPTAVLSA